jgi:Zn-dependent peptidase ImmA (M78 family)/transcriptional regulator with XRE-family HTH domain
MNKEELGKKLRKAREQLGINITDAATRLGYPSYQTLSKIESGEREVKVSELSTFAKIYFCKISDFLEPVAIREKAPELLWRKAPGGTKKKELEAKIFKYAEQGAFLEKVLGIKQKDNLHNLKAIPDQAKTDDDISDLSNTVSDLLGLGKRPAFSLQKVLEQDYSIKVLYYDLGDDGSAASMVDPEMGPVIVINSKEVPWRRNFDLAHELFHVITWDFASPDILKNANTFKDMEKKADLFASNLLLPSAEVEKELHSKSKEGRLTFGDIVDISIDFGVSAQALVYRMRSLRMITWDQATKIANAPELLERNKKAREHEAREIPVSERLCSLAVRCLRKGHISRGRFAEIVQIERPEIDEYIESLGQLSQEGQTIEIMAT